MIRQLIRVAIGIVIVFAVVGFIYTSFPATQEIIDNMIAAVKAAYEWSVAQWGGVTVAGVILIAIVLWFINGK